MSQLSSFTMLQPHLTSKLLFHGYAAVVICLLNMHFMDVFQSNLMYLALV